MVDIILSGDMQAGIELAKHAVEMNPGLKVIYSTARDGAQRHAHHLLDGNEDKGEPRPPNALNLPRRNTTPRSYCRNILIEPRTYKITASARI